MSHFFVSRRHLLKAALASTLVFGQLGRPLNSAAAERPHFNAAIDAAWQAGLAALKPSLLGLSAAEQVPDNNVPSVRMASTAVSYFMI